MNKFDMGLLDRFSEGGVLLTILIKFKVIFKGCWEEEKQLNAW